ncbi:MAG: GNAT family N-acetyltransferase [Bradyrhizobium sp.]|uniref:GNAT family N-acetyltransferase n=1 Tax=Bradyrhizobium sp. TaxID=376 RepID=UPI0011F53D24|nr:GNAT family N-acetyltransferase [Bradyrhizobium sp.]THD70830.1 MAG: GNAT family N-acetyltransferase [Bradyrhizobium sp.]
MVEIANSAAVGRASPKDVMGKRVQAAAWPDGDALVPLTAIAASQWRALAERAVEPNGYHLPDWELAVNASARGRAGVSALGAWRDVSPAPADAAQLIGLLPVISFWRAYRIPLPALVSADPYGTLSTPLLDRDCVNDAVARLMRQARKAGARALVLRDLPLDGAAMKAIAEVLRHDGIRPRILQSHIRACLDARRDADDLLRDALGAKKLKELRRQRNRLAEHGAVRFDVARAPEAVASAVEDFLLLEASGWKARRGTALAQDDGDARFIRRASIALAERGRCEIATLHAGEEPVAAAVVLRHLDRAFYFKLGVDERFAKFSPGVQLTLDLTRHLCADSAIAIADSTASPDHPMINPIWRGRLAIGDVLVPLRPRDPAVSLVHAAITLRRLVREPARRAVHFIRNRRQSRQEKRQEKSS